MKKKIIPIGVSLAVAAAFLVIVLTPGGCAFNLIPYEIHESMRPSEMSESSFIKMFDVIFAIALFFLIRWIVSPMVNTKGRSNK